MKSSILYDLARTQAADFSFHGFCTHRCAPCAYQIHSQAALTSTIIYPRPPLDLLVSQIFFQSSVSLCLHASMEWINHTYPIHKLLSQSISFIFSLHSISVSRSLVKLCMHHLSIAPIAIGSTNRFQIHHVNLRIPGQLSYLGQKRIEPH